MTYEEALTYIHSLDKFGSRPGLDRVKKLFADAGNVTNQNFIHIAGTNGKGSVCTMLSSILTAAGYRTGLFLSPYITDFRERIQINDRMIGKKTLADAVTRFRPVMEKLSDAGVIITEFEFLTVLAFWIFQQEKCDLIVCEVGMGGLLDSTNVIERPLCSVITRIDLDHTAVLGNTIEAIARQKCGIIKPGRPVVAAKQSEQAMEVIRRVAKENHSKLFTAETLALDRLRGDANGIRFIFDGDDMHLPLCGAHQADNLRCALRTVEALRAQNISLPSDSVKEGLACLKHPARFERLMDKPVVILDGAHNRNGLTAFSEAVKTLFPEGKKTLIIGMLADKDSGALELLSGLFSHIIATDVQNPRALPAEQLAERLRVSVLPQTQVSGRAGLEQTTDGFVEVVCSPEDAFDKALSLRGDIFICGSLYLASEIRPHILRTAALGK